MDCLSQFTVRKDIAMTEAYLTTKKVAQLLMVSQSAVRNWCAKGELPVHLTPGGHRRFLEQDVRRFAEDRGLVVRAVTSEGLRLLVVDDDPGVIEYVSELLSFSQEPMLLETAADGFAAGEKLHTFKPEVVLLDLKMPGMDGYSVCSRIKSNPATAGIKVIAMTAFHNAENVARIQEAGAALCLAKPFDVEALFSALELKAPQLFASNA